VIAIVDYGLGNVHAFANIYKRLNITSSIVSVPDQLYGADRIVLPGVGSFDWAMDCLNGSGFREVLDQKVLEQKIPVIGICVGMQMMAKRSDEGDRNGLGWLDAEVHHFDKRSFPKEAPLPHMGWNDVIPVVDHPLFDGLTEKARFYFLHSYFFAGKNPSQILAQCDYNSVFTAATYSGNVFGVQFHPEKSHHWGVRLLKNFAEKTLC